MAVDRGQFSSKFGFILATAGSAVGLGNLAAFPVGAAKNGGAAFLILYVIFVALICFPIMIAEFGIGRSSNSNPIGAFKKLSNNNTLWTKIGGLAVLTPFMIAVFYLVLTVWVLGYFALIVFGGLEYLASPDAFAEFVSGWELYIYVAIVLIVMFVILNGGVKDGIEKTAKILMPLLVAMLIMLVIFVLTLDNASAGISFYLVPDFSKLNGAVFSGALSQAFFSLSLGMGILITYGSYLSKEADLVDSAKLVAIADTAIAFFAGLLILPAIFSFNPTISPEELSTSSVGLIFMFLPQVFLSMSTSIGYVGASIVAAMFFLAVFFAAITSLVSLVEVPVAHMVDDKKMDRKHSLFAVMGSIFVISILAIGSFGMIGFATNLPGYGGVETKSFFDYIIDMFYETILPFIGFIVCIFTAYKWKFSGLAEEIAKGNSKFKGSYLEKYMNATLGTVIPVFILFVFISTVLRIYFNVDIIEMMFG